MYGLPPNLPKDSLHLYHPDAPTVLPMSDPMLRIISVLGLDLGQSQDPSAGCMIERAVRRSDFQGPLPAKWQRDRCTKLARWPLGTDYEKVILDSLNARPDVIVVEYNGVGRPVVDWMRKEATKMQYTGKIVPVLSVGANARPMLKKEARGSHYVIPKIDLVSAITIVLQKKTVFMSKEHAKLLGEELGKFQLRYKKETGNETMGNAPGAGNHDDLCLVGDTLVLTQRGQIPIKEVTTEDQCMTREGWKRVLWSGQTGLVQNLVRIDFKNRPALRCTARHPVWTYQGWISADDLDADSDEIGIWDDTSQAWDYQACESVRLEDCGDMEGELCPVYNLTVEDCPEFVANGILVHNCIAFALSTWYMGRFLRTKDLAIHW